MFVRFLNTNQLSIVTINNVSFYGFTWNPQPNPTIYEKKAMVTFYNDETGDIISPSPYYISLENNGIPVDSFSMDLPPFSSHIIGVITIYKNKKF